MQLLLVLLLLVLLSVLLLGCAMLLLHAEVGACLAPCVGALCIASHGLQLHVSTRRAGGGADVFHK